MCFRKELMWPRPGCINDETVTIRKTCSSKGIIRTQRKKNKGVTESAPRDIIWEVCTKPGEVYSIQQYVIKFVSDLSQVGDFLQVLWFPPSINLTKRTNNDLQNTTQKTKDRITRNPLKAQVLRKGRQVLLHQWHPSCYRCVCKIWEHLVTYNTITWWYVQEQITIQIKWIFNVMLHFVGLMGFRVIRSLVFCVMFCRSLFVLLSCFFWPLCFLFFFDLRILITPLVSSNIACRGHWWHIYSVAVNQVIYITTIMIYKTKT
jgi:hypothetical protein